MDQALALAIGYLLGSIPFGLLLTRAFGAGDLRAIGSGSIGATNVLRTGHKGLAAATVLLDGGKGAAAVLLARYGLDGWEGWAAVAAIVGHCFPVWLAFRGGKGFATAAGTCLALAWPVCLVCAAVWAATVALMRTSSIASLAAIAVSPIAAWWVGRADLVVTFVLIAVVVVFQHRANIGRILRGAEPRFGQK